MLGDHWHGEMSGRWDCSRSGEAGAHPATLDPAPPQVELHCAHSQSCAVRGLVH